MIEIVGDTIAIKLVDTFLSGKNYLMNTGSYSFEFAMQKDSRENPNLQPNTLDSLFTVQITVGNYCDANTLKTGTLTLEGDAIYRDPIAQTD